MEGMLGIKPKIGLRVKPQTTEAFNIMETMDDEESEDDEFE